MKKHLVMTALLFTTSTSLSQAEAQVQTPNANSPVVLPQVSDVLIGVLRSVDTVPSRDDLEKLPNVQMQLQQVAGDQAQDTYLRVRAVTLLSHWPTAGNLVALETLAKSTDTDVRANAIYTIGRAFGPVFPEHATRLVEASLSDSEADVREWATRSLRWIPGQAAGVVLKRLVDDPALGQIARRAQRHRN